jgi:hypothetical protein
MNAVFAFIELSVSAALIMFKILIDIITAPFD